MAGLVYARQQAGRQPLASATTNGIAAFLQEVSLPLTLAFNRHPQSAIRADRKLCALSAATDASGAADGDSLFLFLTKKEEKGK